MKYFRDESTKWQGLRRISAWNVTDQNIAIRNILYNQDGVIIENNMVVITSEDINNIAKEINSDQTKRS